MRLRFGLVPLAPGAAVAGARAVVVVVEGPAPVAVDGGVVLGIEAVVDADTPPVVESSVTAMLEIAGAGAEAEEEEG